MTVRKHFGKVQKNIHLQKRRMLTSAFLNVCKSLDWQRFRSGTTQANCYLLSGEQANGQANLMLYIIAGYYLFNIAALAVSYCIKSDFKMSFVFIRWVYVLY